MWWVFFVENKATMGWRDDMRFYCLNTAAVFIIFLILVIYYIFIYFYLTPSLIKNKINHLKYVCCFAQLHDRRLNKFQPVLVSPQNNFLLHIEINNIFIGLFNSILYFLFLKITFHIHTQLIAEQIYNQHTT